MARSTSSKWPRRISSCLPAGELELPRLDLRLAPLDIAAFLCGHREEDDAPGEMVEGLGVHQPHGRAQHARDLGIVAAGVRGARLVVGLRVSGDAKPVELADEGEGRPLTCPSARLRPHARHGEPRARGEAQPLEGLAHQLCRLDLLEPHLRVAGDALTDADNFLRAAVDGRIDTPAKLLPAGGGRHQRSI